MVYRAPANPACVACHGTMTKGSISSVAYLRCELCAGVWMEGQALAELLRTSERAPSITELSDFDDGSPRRPCPLCREAMLISWLGILQLDRCPRHGIWLDREELQRAMAGNMYPGAEPGEAPEATLLRKLLDEIGD